MTKNILDTQIDDKVAELILGKLTEAKKQIAESYEGKIKSREQEIKEEYSARVLVKLKEKNEHIANLEESLENTKEQLAERVSAFLANSKEDVRALVEEEIRVDSDTLKAQRTLDEIRNLVGNNPVSIPAVDDGKAQRLAEDVQVLKERLESKNAAIGKLKAQLRVHQLVESVPAGDREFYLSQMKGASSITEADETFKRIKSSVRSARVRAFEQEVRGAETRGIVTESATDHRPRVPRENSESVEQRLKSLAGL